MASLALLFAGAAHAAYTPVNPHGNGNGYERCLAALLCTEGSYSGALSLVAAFERDLGLAAGTLERVDDAHDRRWVTLGPQAAVRPFARYAGDDSVLGLSSGGFTALSGTLANTHVWVDHGSAFATDPKKGDFRTSSFGWTDIPESTAPFAFVLHNLSASLYLSSDHYGPDWMVTYRVPGENLYLVAWEDREWLDAQSRPNDYDYNDYVFLVRDAAPLSTTPLPASAALLLVGLALLGATMRRSLLTLALCAPLLAAADEAQIRKSLEANLPGAKVGSIRKLPQLELYEVVIDGRSIIYTDAAGETAFIGRMMDVRTHENLTEKRVEELMRVDFSLLPLERAIVEVRGSGARKVAVFSDPDCPYCKQLERELQGVTDVTIYTFLHPLASIHPDAPRKSRLVWCAPDRARAWSELMLSGREPGNEATCAAPINDNLALGEKLGIEGTPGIVFASGRLVPGLVKRDVLERYLSEKSPAGS